MKYKYQFYKEFELLIIQYKDEYHIEAYLQSQLEIQSHNQWSECLKILIDIHSVSFPKAITIVNELMQARKNEKIHDYRLAYLVENPKSIVITHLYIDKLNNPNYKYCSTPEAIIAHLNLKLSSNELDNMLQELNEKEQISLG